MRLATVVVPGRTATSVAVDVGDGYLADVAADASGLGNAVLADVGTLFAAGSDALAVLRRRVDAAPRVAHDDVRWCAPVPHPGTFFGIGLNYADHAAETGRDAPAHPTVFVKHPGCVTGPFDDIVLPAVSDAVDYEGELGFVVAAPAYGVSAADAASVIGGFFVCDDVSVRDWQAKSTQFTLGKGFPTHGPCGPWVVTTDEFGPAPDLAITTTVSGEVRQSDRTSSLIFSIPTLVEVLSAANALRPGDLVTTGTPSGVGVAANPQRFLRDGDIVEVAIEAVGTIRNRVVAAPRP